MHTSPSVKTVRVWDRFIRIFHWSLVICVLVNYFVIDDGKTLHQWSGYAASMLVAARIVWGFIGSQHARFADFFPTPVKIRRHICCLISGEVDFHAGHNPLGALMMLILMFLVLSLGITGFMQTLDFFWGDERLQTLHEVLASMLIALAGLHAMAAIIMSHIEKSGLIGAMFTGIKKVPSKTNRLR